MNKLYLSLLKEKRETDERFVSIEKKVKNILLGIIVLKLFDLVLCFQFAGWSAINIWNLIPFFVLVYCASIWVKLSLYFWLASCLLTVAMSFSYLSYFGYNTLFDLILIYEFVITAIHLIATLYLLFNKEAKYFFQECKLLQKSISNKKN